MNRIATFINNFGGYARAKELRAAGFQTREISAMVVHGDLERVKPGLYRLTDHEFVGEHSSLVDVCRAVPDGVICLLSALDYFELTTFNPSEVYVAIHHESKPPKIACPPIKPYFFRERFYTPGIEHIQTKSGEIRIYGREKSICDMFRYRNKLGEDLALEALKLYLRQKDASIASLMKFASLCQAKTIMLPYLKALVT